MINAGAALQPFPYFNAFTWTTPVIPDIYMNVYSPEEQYMKLCMEYGKLVAYVDAMADTINAQYESIKEIEDNLPKIIADALANNDDMKKTIEDAVDAYIDSLALSNTYGDLASYGFVTKKEIVG